MGAAKLLMIEKWEGLGNDFIVVDAAAGEFLGQEQIRWLCDRRRGLGGDGVLLVSSNPPKMVVYNADGSRPEMCGNGIRCVAGFLSGGVSQALVIESDAGAKRCEIEALEEKGAFEVSVDMGQARVLGEISVDLEGRSRRFLRVDVGNPHAILFEDELESEASVDLWGPAVSAAIPGGSNIEFCKVHPHKSPIEIEVLVWERGVGRTQACGTGACAVAAAACTLQKARFNEPICVRLPGGPLLITVTEPNKTLYLQMRGPARRVFRAELGLP